MRRWPAVVLTLLALALAGCAPTLPTEGDVSSIEVDVSDEFSYVLDPDPPAEGASPESIITGFMRAGAGPQDDYAIARQYLTDEAAAEWFPDARTFVHSAEPNVLPSGEGDYTMQIPVESHIDFDGTMTRPDGTQNVTFEMEEVDGEWRISSAPDGTILDQGTFNNLYTEFTLYFYDPQLRYTVPDQRWFIERPGLAAEITSRILDGPADWLEQAVVSSFPDDASLGRPSVPVEDQVASVDLDPAWTAGLSGAERQLVRHQLHLTLTALARVESVEITSGGSEFEVPGNEEIPEDERLDIDSSPSVGDMQIGVLDGELHWQRGIETDTIGIPGLPDISELEPSAPAVPGDSPAQVFAFLDGDAEELYHVRPDDDAPEQLFQAEGLTRPSMDNFGWTWTASNEDGSATLRAFPYAAEDGTSPVQISADWLEGREVTSLRIAQDGSRAALIVDDAGIRTLYIAAVVRDGASGTPVALSSAVPLASPDSIEEVRWAASDALVVWEPYDPDQHEGEGQPVAERIYLNGEQEQYTALLGLVNISAGEGQANIYAESIDVAFHTQPGDTWDADPADGEIIEIRDLAYPG